MKRWLIPWIFLSSLAFGQVSNLPDQNCAAWGASAPASNLSCNNTGPYASGTQQFLPDLRGTITNQFEILVIGTAPASLTTTIVGCMRGGTCSGTLGSSSGTASQIVTPTAANLNIYDKYGITLSWTGGDATTRFVVNRTGTTARVPSGGGGAGTVTNTAGALTANAVVLGAGGNDTKVSTGITTNGASELDLGVSGTSGVLGLNGSTSGKATITAPAIAGTTSNGVTFSNTLLAPSITNCTTPGFAFTGSTTTGLFATASILFVCANNATAFSATNAGFAPTGAHVVLIQNAAPTIAAGGCGGAAASIPSNNGPAAFTINVGTTPTSACTITLPAATTDWICNASDLTTASTSVFFQKQTGAVSTTAATITNFNTAGAATAFVASDVLRVSCLSY